MVNPVPKLESVIYQKQQSRLYHPKSTQRQLELKEKARQQESSLLNSLKKSLRKREVIEKLHNIGYFKDDD